MKIFYTLVGSFEIKKGHYQLALLTTIPLQPKETMGQKITPGKQPHLQMVDVLLGIQIYAF